MQIAIVALGGVILLVVLFGFARSLWRSAPSQDGSDRGYEHILGSRGGGGHDGGGSSG